MINYNYNYWTYKFELTKSKYFGFYKEKSDEYVMKYGSYILIDTHFSYANNLWNFDTFQLGMVMHQPLEDK